MTTSWVAGTVRARALARRRVGAVGARALAETGRLEDARAALNGTPYGDGLADLDLPALQHQVAATLLWHLRVLAGWLPRDGARELRVLAGGFEIANIDEHLRRLRGRSTEPAYRLGTLQTAWPRLAGTTSEEQVREVLATSPWGDPGPVGDTAAGLALRLTWAQRVVDGVPGAEAWARGAAVLLVLREAFLAGAPPAGRVAERAVALLGAAFVEALVRPGADLRELRDRLPRDARWVLADVGGAEDLWRAEVAWWHRVEQDAFAMLRRPSYGPACVPGSIGVLAVDAWRVRAALGAAARGPSALEVFDALA